MQGDFDGARKVLELALQSGSARDPEPLAWCFADLAAMYLHRGDTARAKAAAERAMQLVDGYVPAQVLHGRALAREGKTDEAASALARAVEQRPNTEDFLRLVELHELRGDADAAAQALTEARALAARDPRPLAHFLARRSESRAEALELAEQEMKSRHNLWSYDTLALALLRAGRPQEAKEAIDKALALQTPDATFRLHAGLVEAALGAPQAAREHLEAALALDPTVDPPLVDELRTKVGEA
jgi:tetratricopeptide (TPR) repeat protein